MIIITTRQHRRVKRWAWTDRNDIKSALKARGHRPHHYRLARKQFDSTAHERRAMFLDLNRPEGGIKHRHECQNWLTDLHFEIAPSDLGITLQFQTRSLVNDSPLRHDVDLIGEALNDS